jgi:ABC-type transport system substrate-binding protein
MKRLIVLLCLLIAVGVGYIVKSRDSSGHNKFINFAIDNKIKSFDPAIVFNDDSLFVIGQSVETLFQYHYLKRPFEVIPLLAQEMPSISSDGLVYKFKIKKNISYQNSMKEFAGKRTVKAADFVWQIKRLAFKPLKSTGTWLFHGKVRGFDSFTNKVGNDFSKFLTEDIEGLKVIDDYTFEIHLLKPEPNLLYFLAMPFTAPIPKESILKYKNSFKNKIIGTGPYEFMKFENNKYHFSKFKDYHNEFYPSSGDRYANTEELLKSSKKKLPFIQDVYFKIISDEDVKWEQFKSGELDILDVPKKYLSELSRPSSKMYEELSELGIIVKHFSKQTTRWFGFNMNDPVVGKDINLRKAIAYAIDYEKYLEIITNNTNLRANSILNPSIPGYKPAHRLNYDYDLAKAKRFFKKTGYKANELTLTYSTRGTQDIHFEAAEFIQTQLKELGIIIKVESLEFSEFLKKGRAGKLQLWTDAWIYDYPDAENILQLLIKRNHPGINKSGYANDEVDKLYAKLTKTLNKNKRFQIMYEIETIIEKELPWIMLMYESTYIAHHKSIKNFRKSFFIRNYVKYLQKL